MYAKHSSLLNMVPYIPPLGYFPHVNQCITVLHPSTPRLIYLKFYLLTHFLCLIYLSKKSHSAMLGLKNIKMSRLIKTTICWTNRITPNFLLKVQA